jgi:hypothetical protein
MTVTAFATSAAPSGRKIADGADAKGGCICSDRPSTIVALLDCCFKCGICIVDEASALIIGVTGQDGAYLAPFIAGEGLYRSRQITRRRNGAI